MSKKHLALFDISTAERILSGQKTVETRFSQKKIAPYGEVSVGDLVYIKPVGKDLAGQFVVSKIIFFEGLTQADFENIRKLYGEVLSLGNKTLDEKYFEMRKDAKYGTLIFISQVESFITSPIKFQKKDKRGWVVIEA